MTVDETVTGLKAELERCLLNYKSKRIQVEQIQAELKTTKSELENANSKLDESERMSMDAKVLNIHFKVRLLLGLENRGIWKNGRAFSSQGKEF